MDRQSMILVGFMGTGGTSVGEELAGRSGKALIDTDRVIEEQTGMSISGIFTVQDGEAFHRLETKALEQLIFEVDSEMISVGDGLPLREKNRKLLKKLGTVICLRVRPETVLTRLKGDTAKPLLQGDGVEEKVNSLLSKRGPIYEMAADRIISVDGRGVEQVADAIMAGRQNRMAL